MIMHCEKLEVRHWLRLALKGLKEVICCQCTKNAMQKKVKIKTKNKQTKNGHSQVTINARSGMILLQLSGKQICVPSINVCELDHWREQRSL